MPFFPFREKGGLRLLEHLEVLRRMLLSMSAVLLVSSAVCFCFAEQLMNLMMQPAERVLRQFETEHLPISVNREQWVQAQKLAELRLSLNEPALRELKQRLPAEALPLADAIPLLQAAAVLPERERAPYLKRVSSSPQEEARLLELYQSGAGALCGTGSSEPHLMGSFRPAEAFLLSVNISVLGGLVLAFPLLTALLLRFAAPGLVKRERRLLLYVVLSGSALFVAGCAFAYFAVLPQVLHFFFNYALNLGVENDWRIGYYLSFAAKLIFVFGVLFELPVVLLPLIRLNILTYALMRRSRRYAIVACSALSLLLAPAPDPGTMLLMALPMYALYELCIQMARRLQRITT